MFSFCSSEIKGIEFLFISKNDVSILRQDGSFLAERFNPEHLYYLPGTKSFHHFVPISIEVISVKRVSTDIDYETTFNLKKGTYDDDNTTPNPDIIISCGDGVVSKYGDRLWIAVVISVDETEKDCKIRFMHPSLPSNTFFWPSPRDDECNVPFNKVLLQIQTPDTTTGRTYSIHPNDRNNVSLLY